MLEDLLGCLVLGVRQVFQELEDRLGCLVLVVRLVFQELEVLLVCLVLEDRLGCLVLEVLVALQAYLLYTGVASKAVVKVKGNASKT